MFLVCLPHVCPAKCLFDLQGLATPPAVVAALISKITDQLVLQAQRPDGASTFDAQVRPAMVVMEGTMCEHSIEQQQAATFAREVTTVVEFCKGGDHDGAVQQGA